MTHPRADCSLRVFYRDYPNAVQIKSSNPEPLTMDRIMPLADRLLVAAENFLGVVDRQDVILHCYLADDPGEVTLELVYPEANGCLRLGLPREQALALLDRLPEIFDEALLQGGQYID